MKKIIISMLLALLGAVAGAAMMAKTVFEKTDRAQSMSDKHLALFLMMNQWVKVKQEGKNIEEYFKKAGYKKIAVYGMSYAGETLIDELKNSIIHVEYGIDRNAKSIYSDIDIVSMDDKLKKVDTVVVTAITFFDEIKEELSKKMDCPIISLEDILYEI